MRVLRQAGYEVLLVRDLMPGADDAAVLEFAARESVIVLTEDKDFGQLVFAGAGVKSGVILIRVPLEARDWLTSVVASLVNQMESRLYGSFVVIEPGRLRIAERPD